MDDCNWFEKTITRVVAEELDEEVYCPLVKPTLYFGDFMRYKRIKYSLGYIQRVSLIF